MMAGNQIPVVEGFSDFEVLGAGGSGTVYSARDLRHNRRVAVKWLTGQTLDATVREGFVRELQAMGALSDHPYIATVYESGFTDGDDPFLVMPLYENGSYRDKLDSAGALGNEEFLDTAVKVLSALETAHQRNILHRDIKPENLFVGDYGPVLGDFGISTLIGSGRTTTKSIAYTLSYVAPEILNGARQTASSDIYSLGATFHALLVGSPPFGGETSSSLIAKILTAPVEPFPSHVPAETAAVVASMLRRDPLDRPRSCAEIAASFQRLQQFPTALSVKEPAKPTPASQPAVDLGDETSRPPGNPLPASEFPIEKPPHSVVKIVAAPNPAVAPSRAPSPFAAPKAHGSESWQKQKPQLSQNRAVVIGAGILAFALIGIALIYSTTRVGPIGDANGVRETGPPESGSPEFTSGVSAKLGKTFRSPTGQVLSLAWSPDGAVLASGSLDGTVKLWNPVTGQEQQTLTGHTNLADPVAWSPDGIVLASGGLDGMVKLWDPVTGEEQQTLTGHTRPIKSVAWSPDGAVLASGSVDGVVKLWDPVTGEEQQTLTGHTDSVWSVAWSPDGAVLASGSSDGMVKLWDPVTGEEQQTLTGHTNDVRWVGWSPDGAVLASGGADDAVRLWDPVTGEEQQTLTGHTNVINSMAWSPDGAVLASGSSDRTVRLWDPVTGEEQQTLTGHIGTIDAVAWSPDGGTLASGTTSGDINLWDITPDG